MLEEPGILAGDKGINQVIRQTTQGNHFPSFGKELSNRFPIIRKDCSYRGRAVISEVFDTRDIPGKVYEKKQSEKNNDTAEDHRNDNGNFDNTH
jgi:hypothetical protein